MTTLFQTVQQALQNEKPFALATVLTGPNTGRKLLIWPSGATEGDLGAPEVNQQVTTAALSLLESQKSQKITVEDVGEVFVDVQVPPPKLIAVGAVHIAMPLTVFARELGFRTIVVDARTAFATPERFPHVDDLIVRWPAEALEEMRLDEATYVVFLTHDDKLDNPALAVVLQHPVRYVGALGSRKTHAKRLEALRGLGLSEAQLERHHAPIGLDLGGRKPEEIAVSIIAEIVSVRNGG
jgi:xanthine dehydrogenase accessory factor